MTDSNSVGVVAPTPGSEMSESGHIATYMIVNVLLQFHEEVHVFTRGTAVMEFDHPRVTLHAYAKPFADRDWYLRLPGQLLYQLKYCRGIVSRRNSLDVVLFGGSGFVFPMVAAELTGLTILYRLGGVIHYQEPSDSWIRDQWSRFLAAVQDLLYRLADEIIVISPQLAEFADIAQYDSKTSVWCHYYFDLDTFDVRREFENREPVVGQVGIISEVKGTLNFIDAFGRIAARADARGLIVGDGPLFQEAKSLADRSNVDVEFTGRIPRSEVPGHLNRMLLLVISSISEGVPKVALEAMACGAVPVATDVGGISDFITDGETGYLVPDNDPETLATAVADLLESEALPRVSRNGRRYVEENFSYESAVRGYYGVLQTATDRQVELPDRPFEEPIERPL